MSQEIRQLEPRAMWSHFCDLNAVPRPSKKEERVTEFMRQFGESLGLETIVDGVGNVIIRKPASAGRDAATPVILQSHLDMVHQKNNDTEFDFDTQGIEMFVDGDWVKACGTTLGADNGIGVASIMAILASDGSDGVEHPPLEGLFTIDEETGMTGARALEGGLLNGKTLLNLDTEEDTELTIGCAGGVDVTVSGSYPTEPVGSSMKQLELTVKGLTGGHSGMDIHLGRGNANKLINRLLWEASEKFSIRLGKIDGGGLRNAIPRESVAVFAIADDLVEAFRVWLVEQTVHLNHEYQTTDPDLTIELEAVDGPATLSEVFDTEFQRNLLGAVYACHNGIYRMSPDIESLVQTSNNLARVEVVDGELKIACLSRSSVDTERDDLATGFLANFTRLGKPFVIDAEGGYPGWAPAPNSEIVKLMSALHEELFGSSAHVSACHAGLECGILGTNYPDVQMVSFGPNILGAHSPDEKVQISSVQKFWKFLLETLRRI